MSNKQIISKDLFIKRIGDLCLRSGLSGFPKDDANQHILLKSAVLIIGQSDALSEQGINDKLRLWCQITKIEGIDHGTLRRRLVDTRFLVRNKDGTEYQVRPAGTGTYEFEAAIDQIELAEVIAAAREEIELISFTGRKSGKTYTTPVSYSQEDGQVTIFNHAGWWNNLQGEAPVTLRIRGRELQGLAEPVAADKRAVAVGLTEHLRKVPSDAKYYGVTFDQHKNPRAQEVEKAAQSTVMIRVQLC